MIDKNKSRQVDTKSLPQIVHKLRDSSKESSGSEANMPVLSKDLIKTKLHEPVVISTTYRNKRSQNLIDASNSGDYTYPDSVI